MQLFCWKLKVCNFTTVVLDVLPSVKRVTYKIPSNVFVKVRTWREHTTKGSKIYVNIAHRKETFCYLVEKVKSHSWIHNLLQMQLFCWNFLVINPRKIKSPQGSFVINVFIAVKWNISNFTYEKSNSITKIAKFNFSLVKNPSTVLTLMSMSPKLTRLNIFI